MLIIAGSAIQLDIILDNNIVVDISLSFPESATSVTRHVDKASRILLQDLQLLPDQSPLTKTLDKFAANLERLATLDKLSIIPGLDCHEALAGIYGSLERLHKWDIAKLREEPGMENKPDNLLSTVAMCTRHGYPVMHARDRVGFALQYWKELRLAQPLSDGSKAYAEKHEKVWSLLIGCAANGGIGFPPVRVSEDWISKDIVKEGEPSMDTKGPILDWQEPDNVQLPQSEENKEASMEMLQPDLSTARVPQVMFTVAFDPPIILSHNDWIRLHTFANVNAPQIFGYPPTFDSLFFPYPPGSNQDPSELRTIIRQRDVQIFDQDGNATVKPHRNTLFIYKQIYSQIVTEIPFSHPQQLVAMLPLLRQYAFMSTLLENSFGPKTKERDETGTGEDASAARKKSNVLTKKDELGGFSHGNNGQQNKENEDSAKGLNLDVTLWVHPTPHLQVAFPFRNSTAEITFNILEGGSVEVTDENVISVASEGGKLNGKSFTRADLGKVLEHMEDLCKWTEWIRSRLS